MKALTKASQLKRPRYKREKRIVREVVAVKVCRDGREVCNLKTELGREEYQHRIEQMCVRQGYLCKCGKSLILMKNSENGIFQRYNTATFDHENGRGHGGGHRDDRIEVNGKPLNRALCFDCNLRKGSRRGY